MVTPVTVHSSVRVAPRIGEAVFVQVLTDKRSLESPLFLHIIDKGAAAKQLYAEYVAGRIDPLYALSVGWAEHQLGTDPTSVLWRSKTCSISNARSCQSEGMPHEIISDPVRGGPYVRYRQVIDSGIDHAWRLNKPDFNYMQAGADTIEEIAKIWTEGDWQAFARTNVTFMNGVLAQYGSGLEESSVPDIHDIQWLAGGPYIDLRSQLASRSCGPANVGPCRKIALEQRHGVVVHYNGPAVQQGIDEIAFLKGIAQYHVHGKTWNSPGEPALYQNKIAYHLSILRDGRVVYLRDLDDMSWHAGHTPSNEHTLAIFFPLGDQQRATKLQIERAGVVIGNWCDTTGTPTAEVKGHQEVSSTSCPGTLMADVVRPYRAGDIGVSEPDYQDVPTVDGGSIRLTEPWLGAWRRHGALVVKPEQIIGPGLAVTWEVDWRDEQGKPIKIMVFERDIFELHKPGAPDQFILRARLGYQAWNRIPWHPAGSTAS